MHQWQNLYRVLILILLEDEILYFIDVFQKLLQKVIKHEDLFSIISNLVVLLHRYLHKRLLIVLNLLLKLN